MDFFLSSLAIKVDFFSCDVQKNYFCHRLYTDGSLLIYYLIYFIIEVKHLFIIFACSPKIFLLTFLFVQKEKKIYFN